MAQIQLVYIANRGQGIRQTGSGSKIYRPAIRPTLRGEGAERIHIISEKTVAYILQNESCGDPRSTVKMHVVQQVLKTEYFHEVWKRW